MNRPLYGWPALALEIVLLTGRPRGLVGEAFIERHERAREEVAREVDHAADDETGPYRVAPPEGMT